MGEKEEVKEMSTEEMIEKARKVDSRKAYGIVHKWFLDQVLLTGKSYFDSPRWQEHEQRVLLAIRTAKTTHERKALEGLLI